MSRFMRFVAPTLVVLLVAGCSTTSTVTPDLTTVPSVDLDRYFGRWYVIAHTPNFLENGKVAAFDSYARRADGKLDANYSFRKGSIDAPEQEWKGIATIVNATTNAEWKVQLFWPFSAEYRVLELDSNYRWAVVASRGGKWVWILARETSLPPSTYRELQQRIAARGLDAEKLKRIPHRPSDR